jgi:hypothetical protein
MSNQECYFHSDSWKSVRKENSPCDFNIILDRPVEFPENAVVGLKVLNTNKGFYNIERDERILVWTSEDGIKFHPEKECFLKAGFYPDRDTFGKALNVCISNAFEGLEQPVISSENRMNNIYINIREMKQNDLDEQSRNVVVCFTFSPVINKILKLSEKQQTLEYQYLYRHQKLLGENNLGTKRMPNYHTYKKVKLYTNLCEQPLLEYIEVEGSNYEVNTNQIVFKQIKPEIFEMVGFYFTDGNDRRIQKDLGLTSIVLNFKFNDVCTFVKDSSLARYALVQARKAENTETIVTNPYLVPYEYIPAKEIISQPQKQTWQFYVMIDYNEDTKKYEQFREQFGEVPDFTMIHFTQYLKSIEVRENFRHDDLGEIVTMQFGTGKRVKRVKTILEYRGDELINGYTDFVFNAIMINDTCMSTEAIETKQDVQYMVSMFYAMKQPVVSVVCYDIEAKNINDVALWKFPNQTNYIYSICLDSKSTITQVQLEEKLKDILGTYTINTFTDKHFIVYDSTMFTNLSLLKQDGNVLALSIDSI